MNLMRINRRKKRERPETRRVRREPLGRWHFRTGAHFIGTGGGGGGATSTAAAAAAAAADSSAGRRTVCGLQGSYE